MYYICWQAYLSHSNTWCGSRWSWRMTIVSLTTVSVTGQHWSLSWTYEVVFSLLLKHFKWAEQLVHRLTSFSKKKKQRELTCIMKEQFTHSFGWDQRARLPRVTQLTRWCSCRRLRTRRRRAARCGTWGRCCCARRVSAPAVHRAPGLAPRRPGLRQRRTRSQPGTSASGCSAHLHLLLLLWTIKILSVFLIWCALSSAFLLSTEQETTSIQEMHMWFSVQNERFKFSSVFFLNKINLEARTKGDTGSNLGPQTHFNLSCREQASILKPSVYMQAKVSIPIPDTFVHQLWNICWPSQSQKNTKCDHIQCGPAIHYKNFIQEQRKVLYQLPLNCAAWIGHIPSLSWRGLVEQKANRKSYTQITKVK